MNAMIMISVIILAFTKHLISYASHVRRKPIFDVCLFQDLVNEKVRTQQLTDEVDRLRQQVEAEMSQSSSVERAKAERLKRVFVYICSVVRITLINSSKLSIEGYLCSVNRSCTLAII